MIGTKARRFIPLGDRTLEHLVPDDHFYRRLDCALDLTFIRDLVRPYYAAGGRPSIDPVVFFKLQLVMFFEGIRSERQLMRVIADRLSIRWYLGYALHEPLPDHSSLTPDESGLNTLRGNHRKELTEDRQAQAGADLTERRVIGQGFIEVIANLPRGHPQR